MNHFECRRLFYTIQCKTCVTKIQTHIQFFFEKSTPLDDSVVNQIKCYIDSCNYGIFYYSNVTIDSKSISIQKCLIIIYVNFSRAVMTVFETAEKCNYKVRAPFLLK